MCTLSWFGDADTYHVFFNRDELRTRPRAHPPAIRAGERGSYVSPLDPTSGGSWLAVTAHGTTFCLLNQYDGSTLSPIADRRSRGELITGLATGGCDPTGVGAFLDDMPLERFFPFVLAARNHCDAVLWEWTGRERRDRAVPEAGLIATSSSYQPERVVQSRRRQFAQIDDLSVASLGRMHASHTPTRGAASICMHRADASTVSFTHLRVSATRVDVGYRDGPPCAAADAVNVRLDRHPSERLA